MKKIVIAGLVGVAFAAITGGGIAWAVINYVQTHASVSAQQLEKKAPAKKTRHDHDIFVSLQDSIITLSDAEEADHYMLLALALVADSEENEKKIRADEPLYQSVIVTALADKKYEQVRALKINEIKSLLTTALDREMKKRAETAPYTDMLIKKVVFQ